jgi:hypothetical protein
VAGATAQFPLLSIELRHLAGELRRPRAAHGAVGSFHAEYLMFAVGMVPAPELAAPARTQENAVKDALAPWAARHAYLNYAETQQDAATFWTEQAYHRLRRIKTAVDPGNIIRSNHPIEPSGAVVRHDAHPIKAKRPHPPAAEAEASKRQEESHDGR